MPSHFRITSGRQLEIKEYSEENWRPLTHDLIRSLPGSHLVELMWDLARALPKAEVAAQIHPTLVDVREWVDNLSPAARESISAHDMKALDTLLDKDRVRY